MKIFTSCVKKKKIPFYDDAEKVKNIKAIIPSCNFNNVKDDTWKCLELLVEPNVMEWKGPATGSGWTVEHSE